MVAAYGVCGHLSCVVVDVSASREVGRSAHLTRVLGESSYLRGVVEKRPFLEALARLLKLLSFSVALPAFLYGVLR